MGVVMIRARSSRFVASCFRCYSSKPSVLEGDALINSENEKVSREELFKDKKVVIFGVPGAFTPVCTQKHVPSFLTNASELKSKGIDTIACFSVNVNNGVVVQQNVELSPGDFESTSAEKILEELEVQRKNDHSDSE